jgi:2-haloacid dehalogenase
MPLTLAFDVYGTLIDTAGVVATLRRRLGERAPAFSQLWRDKQLEYSFRRGLMQNYADFAVCTRQALDYTAARFDCELSDAECDDLMAAYAGLPAFADVPSGLAGLGASEARLFAFSNGSAAAVGTLLEQAGIRGFFEDVISVEAQRSFKPSPAVYAHFLRCARAHGSETWLVSSNPFDVIGAVFAGWRAAWVKRSPDALFDPWELEPTAIIADLGELPDCLGLC